MLVNATECIGKKIFSTNHDFDTSLFTPVVFMHGMTDLWYGGGWTLGGTAISHLLITWLCIFCSFFIQFWNRSLVPHLVRVDNMCRRGSPEESPLRMGEWQPANKGNGKKTMAIKYNVKEIFKHVSNWLWWSYHADIPQKWRLEKQLSSGGHCETLPCFYFFIESDQKSWHVKFFSTLAALQTNSELGSDRTFAAAAAVQNEDDLLHLVGIKPLCSVI